MLYSFIDTFLAFLGKVYLHGLIQFPKYSQFHAWYLLSFNSSNLWGFAIFIYGRHLKNKVNAPNPFILEELKANIRRETELIRVNAYFLKRCQKCVDEGGQHFQHLML